MNNLEQGSNREDCLLLVNKAPGLTSFGTIKQVKAVLKIKKIGHTGTLDKFAEGLLILLTGKYTRLASLFLELPKEYIAQIELGTTTDTLDPEGKVTGTGPVPEPEAVKAVLERFIGEIEQVPPLFSAIHHEGQRAYKLARSGKQPELKSRKVHIYNLEIIDYNPPCLTIRVNCSKGTYIRALARDLGTALGTCGYVTQLKRTCVGNYKLADAVDMSGIKDLNTAMQCKDWMSGLVGIKKLTVKEDYQRKILSGSTVFDDCFFELPGEIPDGRYFVFNIENHLLAAITKISDKYSYLSVLG